MIGIRRFGSRKVLLAIVAAIALGLAVSYVVVSAPDRSKLNSVEGVLDATQVNVSENSVMLQGEWEFYWRELLTPEDIRKRPSPARWIDIPNSWLDYHFDDRQLDGTGYATFRLVIQLGEQDRNERLALRIPTIFHAYRLWVDGELLAEVGIVGRDKSSMTPQLATKLVLFQSKNDRVELVMQVANYHHNRGGIIKYIELGSSDKLTVSSNLKVAAEMFIIAILMVLGLYHLVLYALRRKDIAPLYFGLFSLMFGIRSLMVGEYLLTKIWPAFPWELQFKIEYMILCCGGYVILRYFDSIYPKYLSRWFHLASRIVTSALCIMVVATPAIIYTRLLLPIGVIVVVHIVYIMAGLVHSAIRRREGALLFLTASVVVLIAVINDFLYYSELSPIENTSPLGLLVFTIAQMILLASRFTRAATNEERITRELQEANDKLTEMNSNLERIVMERTQALSLAHEDLRMSYDHLLHSEQGRKKLLAYITHDLKQPLSSMLGYVEAVQDSVKPERNELYLKYIQDNTIRITRMIEELSFLSHLETGQVSYRMERTDVAQFLRQFYDQYELVVRDAGLRFVLDLGELEALRSSLPVVIMDTLRLEQALFNLVSNAMKFTSGGGLVRVALNVEEDKDSRFAIISVQDTGMGIPPDQLEQIFDRNYRYIPEADRGVEGSGLGLAICREIVQAHGGTVRAESDGQSGSIFYISLPCMLNEGG